MSRYVNVDELHNQGWVAARYINWEPTPLNDNFRLEVEVKPFTTFPAADVQEVVKEWCDKRNCIIVAREDFPKLLEVRHGRWTTERTIEHDGEIYCDQCGWTWENLTFDRTKVKRSPYCPNCGAKMDEVEDDND